MRLRKGQRCSAQDCWNEILWVATDLRKMRGCYVTMGFASMLPKTIHRAATASAPSPDMPPKRGRAQKGASPSPPDVEVDTTKSAATETPQPAKLATATSLFPLTWPVPSPLAVPGLVLVSDASWETSLQQSGASSERVWISYISHVLEQNQLAEPLPSHVPLPAPDPELGLAGPRLGFLGNASQRLALQRITLVFERALSVFPTSYSLHARYLLLRSRFVLGRPKRHSQHDAFRRTIAASRNRGPADEVRAHALIAPEETEQRGDDDFGPEYWDLDSALDGVLGVEEWLSLAAAFERTLAVFPRMPRLWIMYLSMFLHPNCPPLLSHTFARRSFDRALRTLPPTMQPRVWRLYLPWATARIHSVGAGVGAPLGRETGIRVWRRFVAVDSTLTEHYVSLLLEAAAEAPEEEDEESDDDDDDDEADAIQRATARNQSRNFLLEAAKRVLGLARRAALGEYVSPNGKAAHQLFLDWMELATKHADAVGMDLSEEEEQRVRRHIPLLGVDFVDKSPLPIHQTETGDDNNLPPIPNRFGVPEKDGSGSVQLIAQARNKDKLSESEARKVSSLWAGDADPANPMRQPIGLLILAEGVPRFVDQAGRLWTGLATYYLTRSEFAAAMRVFELGVRTAYTMRDFTLTFDAYAETLETTLNFLMEELAELEESDTPREEVAAKEKEVDAGLQRFEALMSRRPWLVNETLLRRNPHDVAEWEKRIALITATADPEVATPEAKQIAHDEANARVAQTYARAVDTVSAARATADLSRLFSAFAKFYESGGLGGQAAPDLESARAVYRRATAVPFRNIEELAEVWCRYAELEVRHSRWSTALELLASAVQAPRKSLRAQIRYHDATRPPQERLWRSLKVWSFYLDLSEAVGGMQATRNAYEAILTLKLATPQIYTNYALFLESEGYFEESLKVYQRGIDALGYPAAFELWNILLGKFVHRYGGAKMERARDLFEQALDGIPPKFAKPILLLYGKLEEGYGLARRALGVYQRGTQLVEPKDKFDVCMHSYNALRPLTLSRRCTYTTLPRRRQWPVCLPHGRSTRRPLHSCPTSKRQKCPCALLHWSVNWAKWIALARSTHTVHSSSIHDKARNTGRPGTRLKWRPGRKRPSARCSGSSALSRRSSTLMWLTWLPRRSRRRTRPPSWRLLPRALTMRQMRCNRLKLGPFLDSSRLLRPPRLRLSQRQTTRRSEPPRTTTIFCNALAAC